MKSRFQNRLLLFLENLKVKLRNFLYEPFIIRTFPKNKLRGETMDYKVLIAEDDRDIVELLTLYLNSDGFSVFTAENGEDALEIAKTQKISIALVDIMMPKMNGYDLIKNIRTFSNMPIIIVSAKNMDNDKILGLNIGADAYLTKPFNPLEIVAYIKAVLRRYYELGAQSVEKEPEKLTVGELELDLQKFVLRKRGILVPLTSTELKIIAKLMQSPERIFTKAQLYSCINGDFYESDDNTMMVHISNIRSKVEDNPSEPKYIKTVRGLGYKIEKV